MGIAEKDSNGLTFLFNGKKRMFHIPRRIKIFLEIYALDLIPTLATGTLFQLYQILIQKGDLNLNQIQAFYPNIANPPETASLIL